MCPESGRRSVVLLTGFCSCASFACLCIAVVTDYWLYATERIDNGNGTVVLKNTSTGLWRKCVEDEPPKSFCSNIQYFVTIDRDGLSITESIIASLRRFTPMPLVSLVILAIAEMLCICGHCRQKRNMYALVAGIMFVIGGLFILMGIVIYIGAITEEAGNKSKSAVEEKPKFEYRYGSSFLLTIMSFITSELNGVLSVYLYISQYQLAYHKEQEQLTLTEAYEVTKSATHSNSIHTTAPRNTIGYTYTAVADNYTDSQLPSYLTNCHTHSPPTRNKHRHMSPLKRQTSLSSHVSPLNRQTSLSSYMINRETPSGYYPARYKEPGLMTSREANKSYEGFSAAAFRRDHITPSIHTSARDLRYSRGENSSPPRNFVPLYDDFYQMQNKRDVYLSGKDISSGYTPARHQAYNDMLVVQQLRQHNRTTPV